MLTRRRLLKTAGSAGFLLGASGLATPLLAQGTTIKIGYVSPQTGPLAGFAEADAFTIDTFTRVAKEKGLDVQVIVKDSQSNPNRAAEVAQELIIDDEIQHMADIAIGGAHMIAGDGRHAAQMRITHLRHDILTLERGARSEQVGRGQQRQRAAAIGPIGLGAVIMGEVLLQLA